MGELPPIRREVAVALPAATAFALFTAHVGAWWPLGDHGVFGGGSTVAFEGGRLVERRGADEAVWAEVVEWDEPRAFRLAWHPGHEQERATDLLVTFTEDGGRTVVRVEHRGWEALAEPAAARESYGSGWPGVLERFRDTTAASAPAEEAATGEHWFALLHTTGPAVAPKESVFAHPAFPEHLAFLARLREQGLLVAAGPTPDRPGTGMTVVRLGGDDAAVRVKELAERDDGCVAAGVLDVEIRPWQVSVHALGAQPRT